MFLNCLVVLGKQWKCVVGTYCVGVQASSYLWPPKCAICEEVASDDGVVRLWCLGELNALWAPAAQMSREDTSESRGHSPMARAVTGVALLAACLFLLSNWVQFRRRT